MTVSAVVLSLFLEMLQVEVRHVLSRCDKMMTYVVARQHFQDSLPDGRYLVGLVYCPQSLRMKSCLANFDSI